MKYNKDNILGVVFKSGGLYKITAIKGVDISLQGVDYKHNPTEWSHDSLYSVEEAISYLNDGNWEVQKSINTQLPIFN